jgi:hypothetical protein
MKKTRGSVYLGIILFGVAAVVVLLQLLQPGAPRISWVIRIAALMGYFCIFGAIVTSAYLRQVKRWFGRPFIKIHHILSIAGLSLVTIHPLAVAWQAFSLRVFIPAVDSRGTGSLLSGGGPLGICWVLAHWRPFCGERSARTGGCCTSSTTWRSGWRRCTAF